jgi:hypothetical protein
MCSTGTARFLGDSDSYQNKNLFSYLCLQ